MLLETYRFSATPGGAPEDLAGGGRFFPARAPGGRERTSRSHRSDETGGGAWLGPLLARKVSPRKRTVRRCDGASAHRLRARIQATGVPRRARLGVSAGAQHSAG